MIPSRFHVYWAGSDRDGAVVGYYWAVTETLATPQPGFSTTPPLPGPKARDYHFTTNSDTTFTFSASIDVQDRVHTLYVYAVDDKGKADPTPARVNFRANDRFPPIGIFDLARATGTVYVGNPVVPQVYVQALTDTFIPKKVFSRDTVPSGALLEFRWHGEATSVGGEPIGYQYKLDEATWNIVDSTVHTATYNTHVGPDNIATGTKIFSLRTVGPTGWRTETSRFFEMNFAPDGWFSGPDLSNPIWTTFRDHGGTGHQYWVTDVNWGDATTPLATIPGTMLSSDSATTLPASRPARKTFFEIYKDQIWAHQEGDTVSMNSFVVFPVGGSDKDSPYNVHVGVDNLKPPGVVTTIGPANGSPVGFHGLVLTQKPNGQIVSPTESTIFPVFDLASVYIQRKISYYAGMTTTGKCYAYVVAEDGDGTIDRRIAKAGGPNIVADSVDFHNSVASDEIKGIRDKVMVFYVNHAPFLMSSDGTFVPQPNASFQRGSVVPFNLLADDQDPFNFSAANPRSGGPQVGIGKVLIRSVSISGTDINGRDTTVVIGATFENQNVSFLMPTIFAPGAAHARIQVCDFRSSDAGLGNFGRCSDVLDVPITITGPVPADASGASQQSMNRPGLTPTGRRQQP